MRVRGSLKRGGETRREKKADECEEQVQSGEVQRRRGPGSRETVALFVYDPAYNLEGSRNG
jgi:hypothetical protein